MELVSYRHCNPVRKRKRSRKTEASFPRKEASMGSCKRDFDTVLEYRKRLWWGFFCTVMNASLQTDEG